MPKTYNELYIATRNALRDAGIEAYGLEARLLVCAAAEKSREALLRDLQLYSSGEIERRLEALTARRLAGEPAAYVTGRWEFYGLDLRVTRDTLIPRMDTEVLVDRALELCAGRGDGLRLLDLCTGTGCIGLALLTRLPGSRAVLGDCSPAALAVARENARDLGLEDRAECVALDVTLLPDPALGSFDLIVSNPPYVPSGELAALDPSVRDFEPALALDGGPEGLDFYRAILDHHLPLLRRGGWLLFEVGEDQAGPVTGLLRRAGLRSVAAAKDTLGVDRVVYGRK